MADPARAGRDYYHMPGAQGSVINPTGPVYLIFHGTGAAPTALPTQWPQAQVDELVDLVSAIPATSAVAALRIACRDSLAIAAPLTEVDDARTLIVDMLHRPIARQWHPLFECIERFTHAAGLEAETVQKLRDWVDGCANDVKPPLSPKVIDRMRRDIAYEMNTSEQPDNFSWLQVYLEPDSANRTLERKQKLFRVELVLWSPRTKGGLRVSTTADDSTAKLWTLDQVPSMLDAVLSQKSTLDLIPYVPNLIVEIVAPSDVLLNGFEHWKYNQGKVSYGTKFRLVVRLQDRLTIPDALDKRLADDRWKEKWTAFTNGARQKSCSVLTWRESEAIGALDLQNKTDVVCVGISSPLLADSHGTFEALRDAGIPIAIWTRAEDMPANAPKDWPQRVSDGMNNKQLCELHAAIQELRRSQDAQDDAKHFYNALTLLWDDPERLPLKYDVQGVFV